MISVTLLDEKTARVDTPDGEEYAVRVDAINGGHLWIWDKSVTPVGRAVRTAIDQAIAGSSSGVRPPS